MDGEADEKERELAGNIAAFELPVEKMRTYLRAEYAAQNLFNRIWVLLAFTRFEGLLTREQHDALIDEIRRKQRDDGGWSLESLGTWKWSGADRPFRAPGTLDASLLARSDGFATGLIVYALRQNDLPAHDRTVRRGLEWLRGNQRHVRVHQQLWPIWRAHSINFDREHGGDKGESWRRMFMSDAATAFAVLALTS